MIGLLLALLLIMADSPQTPNLDTFADQAQADVQARRETDRQQRLVAALAPRPPTEDVLPPAAPLDSNRWTARNTILEALFGAAMVGDYLQTRQIVRAGGLPPSDPRSRMHEVNPVMGPTGNRVPPEVYFPVTMGLHVLGAKLLPEPYRTVMQGVTLGGEAGVVGRNLGLGWKFKF